MITMRLSGLEAVELLMSLIAFLTKFEVKVYVSWSGWCCLRIFLSICLVCWVMWNGTGFVNLLQKHVAVVCGSMSFIVEGYGLVGDLMLSPSCMIVDIRRA